VAFIEGASVDLFHKRLRLPGQPDRVVEVEDRPLWWHLRGLQQTRSGYGRKLTSRTVVRFEGEKRWRRVYVVCFSNSGTAYVETKAGSILVVD
jgi:hypothetical protein